MSRVGRGHSADCRVARSQHRNAPAISCGVGRCKGQVMAGYGDDGGEKSPKLSTRKMMAALRKAAATGGGENDEGDAGDGGGGGDDGGGGGDGAHEVKLAAVERQSKGDAEPTA